jgi:uncharacterized membrane protein YdjX (TVP38/TMEM64 family)
MSRRAATKLALVLGVALIFAVAYHTGLLEHLRDPDHLRRTLVDLGALGYAAFILAYAALQPFGVPGTVFILAAPLIWPWPVAFGLSMTGTMAASVVGFSFTRFVARDWVAPRIPARFRRYEEALERRGLATVFLLRLIFWMPPLLHAFFGVSRVRFGTHFWGSLAGYAIPLFLVSYFGQALFDLLRDMPRVVWVGLGAMVLTIAVVAFWRKRRAAARSLR